MAKIEKKHRQIKDIKEVEPEVKTECTKKCTELTEEEKAYMKANNNEEYVRRFGK